MSSSLTNGEWSFLCSVVHLFLIMFDYAGIRGTFVCGAFMCFYFLMGTLRWYTVNEPYSDVPSQK